MSTTPPYRHPDIAPGTPGARAVPARHDGILRRRLLGALGAGGLAATFGGLPWPAAADGWPDRPVRMVTPWAPGGGTDLVARAIAQGLRDEIGQSVIVDNRPGASGNIGTEYAARQSPDGLTVLVTSASLAIAPALYAKLGYDPVNDLVPVTKMAEAPLLVLVRAESPLRSMADLVALAKREDRAVTYGSFGNGSPSHLIGESINRLAGIEMTHVPYTGRGASVDLINGGLHLAILDALSMAPMVKSGKLRALALNGRERLPALPDVPTLVESGIAFDSVGWHAMFVPTGTPAAVVERLNVATNRVVSRPEVRRQIIDAACFPVSPPPSPAQWAEMFRRDVRTWGELARLSGAKIN